MEEIFASHISNKRLMSTLHIELTQLNNIKTNNLIKNGQRILFFHIRHIDGQKAHEKMFNITNYQETTNQNHIEISLHI